MPCLETYELSPAPEAAAEISDRDLGVLGPIFGDRALSFFVGSTPDPGTSCYCLETLLYPKSRIKGHARETSMETSILFWILGNILHPNLTKTKALLWCWE